VRIFEATAMKEGDLFADFFSVLRFERYDELERPPDLNRSLDIHALEFLRQFNAHVPSFAQQGINPERGPVAEVLDILSTGERMRPDPQEAAAFLDRFAESNAAVARDYLHRPDGKLFASSPSPESARLPSLDTDRAVAIAAALWRWQQARVRELLDGKPRAAG
jgi:hypothetical protein